MSKRIVISVINDLQSDQRVHRVCETLHNDGYQVLLIGTRRKGKLNMSTPYQTRRLPMLFDRGFAFYAEFNLRLFFVLMWERKDLLYANDLDTLPANYLASKLSPAALVYDSHEYFTEVPELIGRPRVRSFWLALERHLFPRLKNVITVNRELAQIYSDKYGVPVSVIRNVPRKRLENDSLSDELPDRNSISDDGDRIIIYQGALNIGRGIELMIDCMPFLEKCKLLIVGGGDISTELKKRAREMKLDDKVVFKGRVSPKSLSHLTQTASLGFSLEEDMGLNYRYALPNKIFDYIHAGIPVIASNLPVMGKFVRENKVGEVLSVRNPEALAHLVKNVMENMNSYEPWLKTAVERYNWNIEKIKFLNFIENVEQ